QIVEVFIQRGGGGERWKIGVGGFEPAILLRSLRGSLKVIEAEIRNELVCGEIVVISAIRPEELGVIGDLLHDLGINSLLMRYQLFEQTLLTERIRRELVIDDRVDRNR